MRILGIHYDRPYLRWTVLEQKGKKLALQSLKSFVPASDEDVKQLYIAESKDVVATGMQSLVRHLDFKISSMKKIEQGLGFQIEALTPLSLDKIVFATETRKKEMGAESTVYLTSKESLNSLLKEWKDLGVNLDLVTSIPKALVQFSKFIAPSESSLFLVHIGSEEWTCVWMNEGRVVKSFVIEGGVESLLSSLWEDRKKVLFQNEVKGVAKQIDLMQLKANLNPLLFERLKEMRNKLSSVFHSFAQDAGAQKVFFTGRTDAFTHLLSFLLQTSPDLSVYESPLPINLEEIQCAVSIGSSLEVLEKKNIQFLRGEFTPAKQWRRAGAWGLGSIIGSFLLSGVFLAWGIYNVDLQKEILATSTKKMIQRMDKNLSESLFANGIEVGIEQAAKLIHKYDREAIFLNQAPTVSEVLAWVHSHPLFSGQEVEVVDLKYHLVSFPKIGAMKDPYQAKVELEFRSKNPTVARQVHEELLKGDRLVDQTQEILWESLTETTRAIFYLKNRTPYVP